MALSAIGGAIGSVVPVIGTLIGGAIGALVGGILGGAKKLEHATIELSVAGDQFIGSQEEVISKQKSFFRGKSITTTTKSLDSALQGFEDKDVSI